MTQATYCYAGGLVEFVKYLNEGAECLHPVPIDISKKDTENKLETRSGDAVYHRI
ncbi:MAG: hypothetical protein MZV70_14085 [Desulfobacterales bacterium]|nr:hypothetical protein [Desulfobacterales bacterium]